VWKVASQTPDFSQAEYFTPSTDSQPITKSAAAMREKPAFSRVRYCVVEFYRGEAFP
jgi:hypothetical protein